MKKGDMLTLLEQNIRDLPDMLSDIPRWKSLLINYEPPTVERVYTNLPNGNRLSLHLIQQCEKDQPFFHPHPWPSAVYIVSGLYEMNVGYGDGLETPPIASTITLRAGSYYEMIDPNSWHSVRPIEFESRSIMINGPVWNRQMPKIPERKLNPLDENRKNLILEIFALWRRQKNIS